MANTKVEKFEDLIIWQEGIALSIEIYQLFKNSKDYGLKDQLNRASVSIPSNVAEGFERQTNKEFVQYLFIAKGSCGEVRTQLYLANKLGIISDEKANELIEKTKKISAMLYKYIQTRKTNFK